MGILGSELNYDKIVSNLGKCCMGEENCGGCDKPNCIIGYAQRCLVGCLKEGVTYVENGSDSIPFTDLKVYNEEYFEAGIAHILRQCRSCQENHFDNCIVSVIRNCYEIGLFGETQKYTGSSLSYLKQIEAQFPEIAENIVTEFNNMEE